MIANVQVEATGWISDLVKAIHCQFAPDAPSEHRNAKENKR
jgi:hypothetical protein